MEGVASAAMAMASGLRSRPVSSTAMRSRGPVLDAAQAVAVAAADIEDAKRLRGGWRERATAPSQCKHGAVGEVPAVEPGKVAKAGAELARGCRAHPSIR